MAWGSSLVGVGDQLLVVSGGLFSSYGVQAPLVVCIQLSVLVVGLLSSCDVLGCSSLDVLCLGESCLFAEL